MSKIRNNSFIFLFILMFLFLLILVTFPTSPYKHIDIEATIDFSTYDNPDHGFLIHYPSDWTKIEKGLTDMNGVVSFFLLRDDDSFKEMIMVFVESIPLDTSLEEYTESRINSLATSIPGFAIYESNKTNLSKLPAHKIVYSNRLEGAINDFSIDVGLISSQIWTIFDRNVYTIKLDAEATQYPLYKQILEEMTDSFVIYKSRLSDELSTNTKSDELPSNNKFRDFLIYKNYTSGIELEYPSDWEIQNIEESQEDIFVDTQIGFTSPRENTLDIFRETFSISIGSLPIVGFDNIPFDILQQYSSFKITELNTSATNFNLLESTETILANNPAHKIVYTYIDRGKEIMTLDITTIKDNKVYFVTFIAEPEKYNDYLLKVNRMIESFKVNSVSEIH